MKTDTPTPADAQAGLESGSVQRFVRSVGQWFCRRGWHGWAVSWWENREHQVCYETRKCKRCDRTEIHHIGGLGDQKWHDLTESLKDYERDWWANAVPWDRS